MDTHCLTIDAFLDGERLDPDALKQALAEPSCRDYLVDVLALRESVSESAAHTYGAAPAFRKVAKRIHWPAAAAILLFSLLAGFAAGYRSAGALASREATAASETVAPGATAPATVTAPTPTRVIRLEPGVDWKESGGD